MNEEIGKVAGNIWRTLDVKGQMTVASLKKEIQSEPFLFDCAVGWLAREDKIDLTREKRSWLVSLRGWQARAANAA
ncbi:MAG: winged helix-turn-helix domain-containing protein [Candidatus Acidiferrales bacterium]